MKRNVSKEKLSIAAALLMFVAGIASCKKNDVDTNGSMSLNVVNAAPNSGPQSFVLANQTLVNGGLDFTDASGYITTHPGTDLQAQFINPTTNSIYATGSLWTFNSQSYTVYLAGQGSTARVVYFQDDLSAPPTGMAKVKFIHLADGAPANIKVKDSTGNNLFSSLVVEDIPTGYTDLNPGSLSLGVYDAITGNSFGNYTVTGLQAGGIYTLYLTGATSSTLSVQTVPYN